LTNLSVNVLIEDAHGYIWAGTESGLFRFGGHRFEEVALPRSFRYVTHLVPSKRGLWVGSHNGLGFLDTASLHFSPARPLPEARTNQLGADRQGRVWVLLAGLRPQMLNQEGQFVPVAGWPGKGPGDALFANPACGDVDIADGAFLWRWKSHEQTWVRLSLPYTRSGESTLAVARDSDDFLWVRSNLELYRLAPGRKTWTTLPHNLGGIPPDGLQMGRDREGCIWFNTVDGMYRGHGERVGPIVAGPKGFAPVTGMVDREGSYWLGSIGVAHVLGRGLWQIHTVENGLPSNVVWHMTRDRQGRIWLATDAGLMVGMAQTWKLVKAGQFSRLKLAPDGSILAVGSPGGDLYRVDPATLRVDLIRIEALPLTSVSRGLAIEPDGTVWVSDFQDGLARGRRRQGTWVWEKGLVRGQAPKGIWHITQDAGGDIFLATRTNLYILESGVWQDVGGTLAANPFSAGRAPDGTVWVYYYEQAVLTRHRREGQQWMRMETWEPFPGQEDRVIFSHAFDARGRLWVGTSRGLGRLDLANHRVEAWLAPGDGIPGADANNQGMLLEGDGTLWYGTTEGVGRLRTQDEFPVPPLPIPMLVSWSSGHQALPIQGATPTLQPGQSLLAHFALNAFSLPGGLQLESRLLGLHSEWQTMEAYQTAFSALTPGTYRLEVRGNRNGVQPGPILALDLKVKPYWWQTWWAMILWVLTLGSLIWAVATLRQRRLKASNRALHSEVQARTADLQQANLALDHASKAKSLFLASMSHELRTPLNAILLYSELMQEEAQERGDTALRQDIQKIQTAGNHLFTLINGVLDLSKIEAGMVEIDFAPCPVRDLFHEVAGTLGPLAKQCGNTFHISIDPEIDTVWADATKLLQVLLNLAGNACKFTERGTITLSAQGESDTVCLEVQDTGKGMTEAEQAHIFKAFEQANNQIHQQYGGTGLGLAISQRLVELMQGAISVQSRPGTGSTFTVRLPRSQP
jgi:signal transduction histidine kinase/ligand-binding sensor domain-containing protein